ncbi:MAG: LysM peptidoglycan-binding domain-containing protein [Myxococcaceae bacterium]|nr:LysM peptidoglycan-binding domain-containing protein [Myxococcaceae bacterium]
MAYQIRPGDTLSGIAARHGTTVAALMRANPQIKNANLIYSGHTLNLPGSSDSFQPAPPSGGSRYTVKPGDTLSAIGARFGVSYQAIAQANGIANPNLIHVGQQLTIPGRNGTPSPGPAPTPSPTPTPTPGPVSGIENRPGVRGTAQQTIDFFMSKGLTRAQAAGIAGNLLHESGFSPTAVGDSGTSFGVAQWHLGRGDAMKRWTVANGYSSTSFRGQLEFLWHELNNNERYALGKLRATTTPYDAGMAFCRYFERPAYINPARGQAAERFFRESQS